MRPTPTYAAPLGAPTGAPLSAVESSYTRMHVEASPPQFTYRARPEGHVIGEKPEAFALWLFQCAGLTAEDDFTDLFPGSGAVGRAWDSFAGQGALL